MAGERGDLPITYTPVAPRASASILGRLRRSQHDLVAAGRADPGLGGGRGSGRLRKDGGEMILSKEEFEDLAADGYPVTADDVLSEVDRYRATIDALAEALDDALTYIDLRDASMRTSASQAVRNAYERHRVLAEKGWISR